MSMGAAGLPRLGPGDEGLGPRLRAPRAGEEARVLVDVHEDDALGRRRKGVGFFPPSASFMKSTQIGQGGPGAGEAHRGVVVEADPDDAQEVGGEAGEPGVAVVVRGAGLARGVGA